MQIRMTQALLAILVLLAAGSHLVGCSAEAQSQSVATREATSLVEPTSGATNDEDYLAQPVADGWRRVVGETDGLVLVLELPETYPSDGDLPWRAVLINETGKRIEWEDHRIGLLLPDSSTVGFGRHPGMPSDALVLEPGEAVEVQESFDYAGSSRSSTIAAAVRIRPWDDNEVATPGLMTTVASDRE